MMETIKAHKGEQATSLRAGAPHVEMAKSIREASDTLRQLENYSLAEVAATLSVAAESLARTAENLAASRPAEWMTSKQAAAYLQRSESGFQNIVAAGEIPKHYLTERGILFNRAEVDEWLMERTSADDCD